LSDEQVLVELELSSVSELLRGKRHLIRKRLRNSMASDKVRFRREQMQRAVVLGQVDSKFILAIAFDEGH